MRTMRFLGTAMVLLALLALTPETPPTGGVVVWDLAMDGQDVTLPGLEAPCPVIAGTLDASTAIMYTSRVQDIGATFTANGQKVATDLRSTWPKDCHAFVRGCYEPLRS
jgi:hypothetical protein